MSVVSASAQQEDFKPKGELINVVTLKGISDKIIARFSSKAETKKFVAAHPQFTFESADEHFMLKGVDTAENLTVGILRLDKDTSIVIIKKGMTAIVKNGIIVMCDYQGDLFSLNNVGELRMTTVESVKKVRTYCETLLATLAE